MKKANVQGLLQWHLTPPKKRKDGRFCGQLFPKGDFTLNSPLHLINHMCCLLLQRCEHYHLIKLFCSWTIINATSLKSHVLFS